MVPIILTNFSTKYVFALIIILTSCKAELSCPNGTIEAEEATAILDCINQARRKLRSGLQTTVQGILLPPAKNMNDLQWDCEIEERLVAMREPVCSGQDNIFNYFVTSHDGEAEGTTLLEYLTEKLARIEDEAPTNITENAVFYNNQNISFSVFYYNLYDYLHLVRASTQKFACILVGGDCEGGNQMHWCATDEPELENGDIVYEIAEATTSVATTENATTSVATTAKATASVATTGKATTNVATVTSLKSIATSSTRTSPKHITECASALTTPSCITQSPRRFRREAKGALFKSFVMKKTTPTARREKTHRKQLRNMPMTLTAHRTHAAKTATGAN